MSIVGHRTPAGGQFVQELDVEASEQCSDDVPFAGELASKPSADSE